MTKIIEYTEQELPNVSGVLPVGFSCPACASIEVQEVECTREEIDSPFNCGRSYACCCVALSCGGCGARIRARREAPDVWYDDE